MPICPGKAEPPEGSEAGVVLEDGTCGTPPEAGLRHRLLVGKVVLSVVGSRVNNSSKGAGLFLRETHLQSGKISQPCCWKSVSIEGEALLLDSRP